MREINQNLKFWKNQNSLLILLFRKEQNSLESQARQLEDETQDIVIKNYKTFLKSTATSKEIAKGFSNTSQNLNSLIEKLPDLTESCNNFMKESMEITAASRVNSLTLKKNSQLLEILELPALMENFINEYDYDSSLELASYVQRLGVKLGHVPIVNVSKTNFFSFTHE